LLNLVFGLSFPAGALCQSTADYDTLVQKGKAQLQAGAADLALASGEAAIKMNADRWEGYALAGGALMNVKRYEDAADKFSHAIDRAPEAKQPALRDLRRNCLMAESAAPVAPKDAVPTLTSQPEIVLWKSIENSTNPADFQSYLDQYPHGAFVVLAQRHLSEAEAQAQKEQQKQQKLKTQAEQDQQSLSHRIYVVGEVAHTGAMPLLPNMTVLQALSSAGLTRSANPKVIYLLRVQDGQQTKIPFNYKDAIKGPGAQQDIVLKPGDTIVVP